MLPFCFSMYTKKTKVKRLGQHNFPKYEIRWLVNEGGGTGRYESEKKCL